MATHSGLEFVGLTLKPGKWASEKATEFWYDYISLVGVRQENSVLKERVDSLERELADLHERATEAERLKTLLEFSPPETWRAIGARIIAHRLGPNAAMKTVLLDKGAAADVGVNTPMITPAGVAGRVLKSALHFSTALLITDPGSKISVLGRDSRTPGILTGQGPGQPLAVNYVHQNARLAPGEILVTSGLDGIFPKGLPAARVLDVRRSDISLFQEVTAEPLVDLRMMEEVLLLMSAEPPIEDTPEASAPENAEAGTAGSENASRIESPPGATPGG